MKRNSRILHYQLIPLLIFSLGYPLLRVLGGPQAEVAGTGVDLYAFLLALAMAFFPVIVIAQLAQRFHSPGFALLNNGTLVAAPKGIGYTRDHRLVQLDKKVRKVPRTADNTGEG